MKKSIPQNIIILILFFVSNITMVLNAQIKDALSYEASYTGDFTSVLSGGMQQKSSFMGMMDAAVTFDTEKAGLWNGGTFFIHGLGMHGGTPTANYVGDLQVFSNIEAGNFTSLYELYFSQSIGKLTITLGQHDLNSEFVTCDNAATFTNSSFGIQPGITLNIPVPIFPVAALGVIAKYDHSDNITLISALYDGDPGSSPYGADFSLGKKQGFLSITEIIYNSAASYAGSYKVGFLYHSADFQDYINPLIIHSGNLAFYATVEQSLMKDKERGEGLETFLQIGITPQNHNLVQNYLGAGLKYSGLVQSFTTDEVGIGLARIGINKNIATAGSGVLSAETDIEVYYKFQVNDNIFFQPDLHYIIHPGVSTGIDNAFIGMLRLGIEF